MQTKGAMEGRDTYSKDFYADLRIGPLADLYKRSIIELEEIKWKEIPKGIDPDVYNLIL